MTAGREMDARVAEKVMGIRVDREFRSAPISRVLKESGDFKALAVPFDYVKPYSTDIAAAWQVLEKISSNMAAFGLSYCYGFAVELNKDDNLYTAGFRESDRDKGDVWEKEATAPTAPLAICAAALAAVGEGKD